MTTVQDQWMYAERIQTEGCWLPSSAHCSVSRFLRSYSTELDAFIAHLRAVAEGLDDPRFTDFDLEENEVSVGVCGYRLRTNDEHTAIEAAAIEREAREREELARLIAKYAPESTIDRAITPDARAVSAEEISDSQE